MTALVNSFEGGSPGTTITTGNSGGVSGNAFNGVGIGAGAALTYDNTVAAHGSVSAKVVTTATAASSYVLWSTALGTVATAWFRQYLYFAALPGGSIGLVTATSISSALCAQIGVTGTGHLFVDDGTGTNIHSFSTALPTGQWVRIEGFVTGDPAAGQISLQLYLSADGGTPTESFTSTATQNTTAQVARIAFGAYFTASNVSYWQDDVGVSGTGYLGPVIVPTYLPVQASPPGMLSPAAFPMAGPSFLPADAPPVTPQPYFAGRGTASGTTNHVTASVTTQTGPGDAIVVMVDYYGTMGPVVSCTDTQGNTYSTYPPAAGGLDTVLACVAQNTVPLSTANGDSVTVTFANTVSPPVSPQVFIIGCSAGAVLPGGGSWVTVTASGAGAEGGGGSLNVTSPGAVTGPAVILACSTATSGGYCAWPQNWNVLASGVGIPGGPTYYNTNVAARYTSSPIAPGSVVASVQSPSTVASAAVVYVVLQLETRVASQHALMSGLPSPPGFIAPGTAPDVPPLLPGTVNDSPPVTPVPYQVGTALSNGSPTSLTIPVTAATSPGDAIVVFSTAGIGSITPLSASDTQGNSYSLLQRFTSANQAVWVAQRGVPLSPANGDSITVTWSGGHPMLAVAAGVPVGAVGGSGENWLTYDLFNQTGSSSSPSITLNAPASSSAPGVPEVVMAFSASSTASGPTAAFGQDFTVIGNTAWAAPTAYTGTVAYKVAPNGIAPGALVAWTQQAAPNAGDGLMYLTFRLETRVAPNQPVPLMPPGMQSPGAWQYDPFVLPNDAPPTTPQPYFIGQFGTNVSGNTAVIPVQNPTNAGDAIIVSSATTGVLGAPTSCTDTQGNTYSIAISYNNANPVSTQYISQNSRPLTSTDTITVTYPTTAFQTRDAVAVGVPAASVVTSYGNSWLTNVSANTNNSSASNSSVNVFGAAPVSGPMMVIGYASYSTPGNPPTFPQNWQVIRSFTAGSFTITVAASPVVSISPGKSVFQAVGTGSANFIAQYVALQLETRIASQPGLMAAPPVAPGFIAPSSGPDIAPFTPGVINDAPPQNAPYVIGYAQGISPVTVPVQAPTSPGDTIVVLWGMTGGVTPLQGLSDTQGNTYGTYPYSANAQTGQGSAVNTAPLGASDSITAQFGVSGTARAVIAVGIPAATVGAQGPDGYAVPTGVVATATTNTAANLTWSPLAARPGGVPAVQVAVVTYTTSNGPLSWPSPWVPLGVSPAPGAGGFTITGAWRAVTSIAAPLPTLTLLFSGTQPMTGTVMSYVTESRFAPRTPPDMPPGMLAPGAWQYTPMARAIGSLAQLEPPSLLSGAGTLTAGAQETLLASAVLSGSGGLAAGGFKRVPGAAALSGTGKIRTAFLGFVNLAGTGTLTAAGFKRVPGAAHLAGAGGLISSAQLVRLAYANLAASAAVSAAGTRGVAALAAFTGSPVLTCSYLSARIVIAANIMFPGNQSGTYGAAEPETTVIVPGVTDGTYT